MMHDQNALVVEGSPVQTLPTGPSQRRQFGDYGGNPQGYGAPDQEDSIDLTKLFWLALAYRWLIFSIVAAGVVLAVLVTWLQTPMYRGTTKVEIVTSGARVFQDLELVSQSNDRRLFETVIAKMRSRDLARRVVYALNLTEQEDFLFPKASFSLRNVLYRAFGLDNKVDLSELTSKSRENIAIGRVLGGLSIQLLRNTQIVTIDFVHESPEFAASVPDQVARSHINQGTDNQNATSDLARQFIQEQVVQIKNRLETSEKALVAYAKEAQITVTDSEGTILSTRIADINTSLSAAINERLAAERDLIIVKEGNAASLELAVQSPSIQKTNERLIELKGLYQEKLSTLKPGFPEMRRLRAQMDELVRQANIQVQGIARSVEIKFEQAISKEKGLRAELAKLEREQSDFQEKNISYTILKREVDSNRKQYDSLISKLNEVGVGAELNTEKMRFVDAAVLPGGPFSPNPIRNIAIGGIFASVIAFAIIAILELFNNTFRSPDQVESVLKLPILGIIPLVSSSDRLDEQLKDPSSAISEAYRTLRTSVQFTGTEDSLKSLLITSAQPSEGKSTAVYKLAAEFGALGRSVMVVDADMRRPRMHQLFNTHNRIGLSNLLTNVVQSGAGQDLFKPTDLPNVTLLSAGTIPPNPSDLIASQKMSLMLQMMSKKYDIVLVDGPPLMGLADAVLLSRQVDGVLPMVSYGQVPRKAAEASMRRLRSVGANVIGVAMTKFSVKRTDYNYAYKYLEQGYDSYYTDTPAITHDQSEAIVERNSKDSTLRSWINRFSARFG